ncbi:ATP-binding protein [Halorarum halobium]|uniref:ATP-binding protein n=1 Tax=Halorarum halobium TaxID=3075121 RepID=UPI0028ACD4E5|nr:ATPase [Halobaculum sp. XH14]
MHVIGRTDGEGPTADLGRYLARDGSTGGRVALDLDRPHAGLVVGKRGSGKSYTLGVLVEEVTDVPGLAPVVLDPMDAFAGLVERGGTVHRRPRVRADAIPPAAWPELLELDPASEVGGLVWRAFTETGTLRAAIEWLREADAERAVRRAGRNHLSLAASWDVFSPDGLGATDLDDGEPTVLDCSALPAAATNAICRAIASGLYRAAVGGELDRLPWLFLDEAHVCFDGLAGPALGTLLTRGRSPGVSLICATQRPRALPSVARSQADLLVAHRLTTRADLDALVDAHPALLEEEVADRLALDVGEAVVVDDATESAHSVRIRTRETRHDGDSPRASAMVPGEPRARSRDRTGTPE